MKIRQIAKIRGGQDGAIWNGLLFRFDSSRNCYVFDVEDEFRCVANFTVEGEPLPHCNTAVFSGKFFDKDDEFPLLYLNVYNSYEFCEDQQRGTLCVYRVLRKGESFALTLVQIIRIGFAQDHIWCSPNGDIRPFGNMVTDIENDRLYVFNMMDGIKKTRYFTFRLPDVTEGELTDGVKTVTLAKDEIISYFDCEYHNYLQGAVCHEGLIYSVEGGTKSESNPAVIRIIDPANKKQLFKEYFRNLLEEDFEPELIDFYKNECYYGDNMGNLFIIKF